MMNMCLRYAQNRDDAAIIVNDGFLRVFKKIAQYNHSGSIEGWIRRIVYHSISDFYKKENKKIKFLELEDYDHVVQNVAYNNLYLEDIVNLIDKVPRNSGEVFRMFAIEGYSHKEIAAQKGISVGTSKWHLAEARKRLKKLILDTQQFRAYVIGE